MIMKYKLKWKDMWFGRHGTNCDFISNPKEAAILDYDAAMDIKKYHEQQFKMIGIKILSVK